MAIHLETSITGHKKMYPKLPKSESSSSTDQDCMFVQHEILVRKIDTGVPELGWDAGLFLAMLTHCINLMIIHSVHLTVPCGIKCRCTLQPRSAEMRDICNQR